MKRVKAETSQEEQIRDRGTIRSGDARSPERTRGKHKENHGESEGKVKGEGLLHRDYRKGSGVRITIKGKYKNKRT